MRFPIPPTNLMLVVFSVVSAVLLWVWVGAEERSEIVVSVPLEYRNIPQGYEILTDGKLTTSVNVWVNGNSTTIQNLRPEQVSAWVDLQNAKSGQKVFELTPDQVRVPYGFSVLRISPSRIDLRIEQVTTRMVPVIPRFDGKPQRGYELTETKVVPPQVEIIGPRSAVLSVRGVITDSIGISELAGSYTERVNVGVDNSAVRLGSTKDVTVTVTIAELKDVITLRQIPIKAESTNFGVRFNPRFLRVDLLGPKRLLSQINRESIQAELEIADLKPGIYQLTPKITINGEMAKDVSVKGVTPARIHVRIM